MKNKNFDNLLFRQIGVVTIRILICVFSFLFQVMADHLQDLASTGTVRFSTLATCLSVLMHKSSI